MKQTWIANDIPPEVEELIRKNAQAIAGMIADEARASTAFSDKTGKLRSGIKPELHGKFWRVYARAPHAHLVEFGHGGPHPAPAHPFLRPAKERVISQIK